MTVQVELPTVQFLAVDDDGEEDSDQNEDGDETFRGARVIPSTSWADDGDTGAVHHPFEHSYSDVGLTLRKERVGRRFAALSFL